MFRALIKYLLILNIFLFSGYKGLYAHSPSEFVSKNKEQNIQLLDPALLLNPELVPCFEDGSGVSYFTECHKFVVDDENDEDNDEDDDESETSQNLAGKDFIASSFTSDFVISTVIFKTALAYHKQLANKSFSKKHLIFRVIRI